MRNITQQEVDAIRNDNAPIPEKVMFAIVGMFSGNQALYHAVPSANANYFLQEGQFLAESADGKEVSVIHINNIRVPEKKPQVEQKKRKKYKRPCNGVDYLEKIPFEYSKVKVGDKVVLRDGTKDVIVKTRQNSTYTLIGTRHIYTKYEAYWADEEECGDDILYILRKTKKSVPKTEQKKDEFRFVNEATGQEIVFSRDELQVIKELFGALPAGVESNKRGSVVAETVYRKLEVAGFSDLYTMVTPHFRISELFLDVFKKD